MAPIEKLIELCPDKNLLDPNFGGYKLSLSQIPTYKKEIEGIDLVEPSDEQYAFLHQKEFALHNHLHGDVWNEGVVYYVNKNRKIMRVAVNDNSGQLESPQEVWEISEIKPRLSGDYNVSLCFASSDIAVLCDGAGMLYILHTQSRDISTTWKLLHEQKIIEENRGFKLIDCRSINEPPNRAVYCVLRNIRPCKKSDDTKEKHTKFEALIHVVSLIEERGHWKLGEVKEVCNASSVEYSVLEPDCKAVYIAGDIPTPNAPQQLDADDDKLSKYHWQQNFEDVKVWFEFSEPVDKNDIVVDTKDTEVKVCVKDNTLLEGKLFHRIDPSLTTWSLNDKKLEVVLQKSEERAMWKYLVEGSDEGKEVIDETVVKEIHSKLSHLCSDRQEEGSTSTTMLNSSQLEECDAFDEESRTLVRLNLETMEPTHKVMLGGQQWLLNIEGGPEHAGGFCLRYDVDGCVWRPQGNPSSLQHLGTFLAFGYIEASKTNKKFVVAPPDLSYIAILDVTNHVMVYRKGVAINGKLRNRKTGQQVEELAIQQLVSLQTPAQPLGAIARSNHIFVLTSDHIFALVINQD